MTSYLAKQQAYKEDPEAFAEGQYFGASMMPGTGEAIAAYELPGILSQAKTLMQDPDYKKALLGLGLGILGTASVAPGVGPFARGAKRGLEGFIPYLGSQPALAGGPGIDSSITKIIASEGATGGSEKIAKHKELSSKKKSKKAIFKENKSFVDTLDNKISFEIDTRNADLLEGSVKKTDKGLFGSHFLKPNPNQEYGIYKLQDLLTGMDDLFEQYPDLKNAYVQPFNGVVEHNGQLVQAGGAVDFQDFVIKLGPGYSQKNLTEKLLHETQHLVDFLEGRQPGGSPLMFTGTAKQKTKNYKRLAGEVRARLVQDRFYYNLQDEFPRPDTSPKKVLETEDDIMKVGGQSFEGANNVFNKINTPVYHYSPDVQLNFTQFDPDKSPAVIDSLGVHVGTKKAAKDRYEDKMRSARINNMPSGNVGYGPDGKPIPRTTFGGTFPLLADTSKPFTPKGAKQWSEFDLNEHLINEFNKTLPKGQDFDGYYTMKHLSAEPGFEDFPFTKFRAFVKEYRKKLAKDGFTHIPYLNDVEDPGSVSFIMLVDRPKGSTKVLQSPFAKKDPRAFDDPDIMKQEGGVVEMKDKAINMNRRPRGIGPFAQYLEPGGVVKPERNIFEEQAPKIVPAKTEAEALSELADQEMGLELINRVGFDPLAYKMMQAGLRDNRTLSDFLTIYPTVTDDMTEKQRKDALTEQIRGIGLAQGMYFPLDNMVVVAPMNVADDYFQSPTDMIIMHEILHKGAETLKKDPNVNIKSLREKLDTEDYANIGDETKPGRAEHRYIQAIVNKAYVDNMLTQSSIYANRAINEARKILNDPKSDDFKKELAKDAIKFESKYVERNQKRALLKEIRRSTDFYMEQSDKNKFKQEMNKMYPNKGLFDEDADDVENNFTLKELKQIFNLLNTTMLDQPGTKEFALEMSKSAPAGASIKGYSDLFPTQFADPTKPYFTDRRKRTYDLEGIEDPSYIQVMSARSRYLEKMRKDREKQNKAKGGVVEMKDKAVNMYRGTQGIEPFIKYMV